MERGSRLALILGAAAVGALAFVLLQPDGADEEPPPQSATTGEAREQETPRGPAPEPEFATIRIVGGEVQNGPRRITVDKGETARIRVRSDAPDEIHLHGYDLRKDVAPGEPAKFVVDADIEGVFEIEAHDLGHAVIGQLIVEP